jgi:hypothetical protein
MCAVATPSQLRDEAAVCRQLAREIKDPSSAAMFDDRAEQLELRAAALAEDARDDAASVGRLRLVGSSANCAPRKRRDLMKRTPFGAREARARRG